MKRPIFAFLGMLVVAAACSQAAVSSDQSAISSDAGSDGSCGAPGAAPTSLECAGLYADFATKRFADNVEPYAPAVPLWSDGAEKTRWILLPLGTTIDTSNPNEWKFPVGTKLFKEFKYRGKRVETRLFQKATASFWVHATYKWNADDSATTISYGEMIPFDGTNADGAPVAPWVIPKPEDCDSCHRGRSDRILGFEEVNLGLPGATGLTLSDLSARGWLSVPPAHPYLTAGNDATGISAAPLTWLHTNCGITCHNRNEGSLAFGAGMFLRLDPAWLDGSPATSTWDPLKTTVGVAAVSGTLAGTPRIAPGDPKGSAIVQLISQRGDLQMPPSGLSQLVDNDDVAGVDAWIGHMAAPPKRDAGTGDAGDAGDAGGDAADAGDAD